MSSNPSVFKMLTSRRDYAKRAQISNLEGSLSGPVCQQHLPLRERLSERESGSEGGPRTGVGAREEEVSHPSTQHSSKSSSRRIPTTAESLSPTTEGSTSSFRSRRAGISTAPLDLALLRALAALGAPEGKEAHDIAKRGRLQREGK